MSSIEILKKELIAQKELIERLSGQVTVANSNPSPTEITAGIKTIPAADLTGSTATEADVMSGKTFYSGSPVLRTGTANFSSDVINALFMPNPNEVSYDGDIYYTMPEGLKVIRQYAFYNNSNKVHFTFGNDLINIADYAFYQAKSFVFDNFENLTKLKEIGLYAFSKGVCDGMDFTHVPNNVEIMSSSCFAYVNCEGRDIRFPDNLKTLGQSAYRQDSRVVASSVDFSNFKLTAFPAYTFINLAFGCDLIIPASVTTVGTYFNQDGCFSNITIPATVVTLQNYCFGSKSTSPISNFYLRTVTFEGTNPPSCGIDVFAHQNVTNGFKIYVPDEAIDEYKSVSNLAYCSSCIYPISQKE